MNRRSFISMTATGLAAIASPASGSFRRVNPDWATSSEQSWAGFKTDPELNELVTDAINGALYVRGVMKLESAQITELQLGGTFQFKLSILRANRSLTLTSARRVASEIATNDARIQLVDAGELSANLGDRVFCSYEHKKHVTAEVEIDPQPLRYNDWPEFIEPEARRTGPASLVNPDWVRAKNEVAIGVQGTPFLRRAAVNCREVNDATGHYYACSFTREWVRLGGQIGVKRIKRPTSWMALDYGPRTVKIL